MAQHLNDEQRRRAAEAYAALPKAGKSQRVPKGAVADLARRFNVSPALIKNIASKPKE